MKWGRLVVEQVWSVWVYKGKQEFSLGNSQFEITPGIDKVGYDILESGEKVRMELLILHSVYTHTS